MVRAVIERADVMGFQCNSKRCAPPIGGSDDNPGNGDASTAGTIDQRSLRSAERQSNLARARDVDEGITDTMKSVANAVGGRMAGLKFKYKKVDKIAEKIQRKVSEKGLSPEKAERGITDALRFTMVFTTKGYTKGVSDAKTQIEDAGLEIIEESNKWVDGTPYAGHHLLVRSPRGQVFELQFHTAKSLEVKEGKLHKLYEIERKLPKQSSAEYKSMSKAEQAKVEAKRNDLTDQMWTAAAEISVPPTVERLPSSEEYTPPEPTARRGPNAPRLPREVLPRSMRKE
jgi:ppGpp synthetase/RelA/SpoT-type nucleotidyltranferase